MVENWSSFVFVYDNDPLKRDGLRKIARGFTPKQYRPERVSVSWEDRRTVSL